MNNEDLIQHAKRLMESMKRTKDHASVGATATQIIEFLRNYAGPKSAFLDSAKKYFDTLGADAQRRAYIELMHSFIEYIENGLYQEVISARKVQMEVVSDLLRQANELLEDHKVHPAAPAVMIGAALEEYLRTWMERESLSLGTKKPGLDGYGTALLEGQLITTQDIKDITSWAKIHNHAVHGEWEEVSDRKRIALMLEGVNLFMRKYNG